MWSKGKVSRFVKVIQYIPVKHLAINLIHEKCNLNLF